jgi:DNA polymerase III delta prime subunit
MNPFQYTKYVSGTSFYGRESLLKEILDDDSKLHILILGLRRSGKTSLLKELERRLKERNPNIVFENIQSCEDIDNLKNRIAFKLKSILTANALESFNSKSNLPDAIEELNNVLERESQELVILCDEAETFLEWHPFIDPMLKKLKAALELNNNIRFILAASRKVTKLDELCNWESSPFLQVFEKKCLTNFDFNTTASLILQEKLETVKNAHPEFIDEVYDLTNGNPFLIQVLCRHAYNNGIIEKITDHHIREVRYSLGQNHYFEENLKQFWHNEYLILGEIAERGIMSKNELVKLFQGSLQSPPIESVLEELTRFGHLKQVPNLKYSISNYFLTLWIKENRNIFQDSTSDSHISSPERRVAKMEVDFSEIRYPKKFEELCAQLIISEYPEAKRIGGSGDEGVDAFVGSFEGEIKVFQSKYFIGRLDSSRKTEIKNSLERVCDKHCVKEWILCIPMDFTPKEQRWFDELEKLDENVRIDYWGKSKLINLLEKHANVRKRFFGQDFLSVLEKILANLEQSELDDDLLDQKNLEYCFPSSKTLDIYEHPARFLSRRDRHELIEIHKKNLVCLLKKKAIYGMQIPTYISDQIEEEVTELIILERMS